MVPILDIHEALPDERLQAYRNMHEVWNRGMSLEKYMAWRHENPAHQFAQWFVGTRAGEVVTSLACYPLQFCWDGNITEGIGIGAVYTAPGWRRQGFAASLVEEVLNRARSRNAGLALLYSDIDAAYYEQFGFVRFPSLTFRRAVSEDSVSGAADPALTLQPIESLDHLRLLSELYEAAHEELDLWLHRNTSYWKFTIPRDPPSRFYVIQDDRGRDCGYVRLQQNGERLEIGEMAIDRSRVAYDDAALLPALDRIAKELGAKFLSGWLPPTSTLSCHFSAGSRSTEITMLASLDPNNRLTERTVRQSHFWSADHF